MFDLMYLVFAVAVLVGSCALHCRDYRIVNAEYAAQDLQAEVIAARLHAYCSR